MEANGVNPINDEGGGLRSNRSNALLRPTVAFWNNNSYKNIEYTHINFEYWILTQHDEKSDQK